MPTANDVTTLDFTDRGAPFCRIAAPGVAETGSLDLTDRGQPMLLADAVSTPYDPVMYANPSMLITATGSLSTEITLAGEAHCQVSAAGFLNLGETAKLVNVF